MNLQFQWEQKEWSEALSLASAGPRGAPKPVMTYAVLGIMSLGAVGEFLNAVHSANKLDYSESLMPLLVFAGSVVVAMQVYTRAVGRGRTLVPMPIEEQELLLTEHGWRATAAHESSEIRPWGDLYEQRRGRRSLILVGRNNTFAALPLRALSTSQGSHLHRLLMRKLRN